MMDLDNFIAGLPQDQQDTFRVAQIENEEAARRVVDVAREKNLRLAIKDGEEVFLNVNALKAVTSLEALKAILGTAGANDFSRLIVSLGDIARAAQIYVADEA